MELQAFRFSDVTPRTTGILDLWSHSPDGIYEVREHLCGSDAYKLLTRGNYTDISLSIGTNTCIKIANIGDRPIHVHYRWDFDSTVNALFISTILLYVLFLAIIGIITCIGCGFGGKLARFIYDKKIVPYFNARKDTCRVDLDNEGTGCDAKPTAISTEATPEIPEYAQDSCVVPMDVIAKASLPVPPVHIPEDTCTVSMNARPLPTPPMMQQPPIHSYPPSAPYPSDMNNC